jgi:glycosyltransferase involved in cell wall biosynthesis
MKEREWMVPEYVVHKKTERKNAYCLVIPVINEGERIQNQLRTTHELGIHEQVDTIIVDGGSTDGSLEADFLEEVGVRHLLEKTATGKLSAQLRCAYSYALQEGYEGIITIDGNNKDDPADIPKFINALDDGIDFAQASRFLKGGVAENTPFSRYIAIRAIHAPLLRVCSGFPWTDTTQGFRAYSAKMLRDNQIQPFRSVFDTYELLAYLSYRVPKVGFRCVELPTTRIYPKGEVPTKISAFKGNLAVMEILGKACLGHYNP